MRQLSVPSLLCLGLWACQSGPKPALQADNLPLQTFRLEAGQAANIKGQFGTQLTIAADAFVGADGQPITGLVEVRLREALSLGQAVAAGLVTISGNQLLRTGGMIYVDARGPNGEILSLRSRGSVQVQVPARQGLQPGMKLYQGQPGPDGTIDWANPEPLANDSALLAVENGEKLFKEHCTQCHGIANNGPVGPHLGNVHKRRTREWLWAFTRSPQQVIDSGDSIGLELYCEFEQYMPNCFDLDYQQFSETDDGPQDTVYVVRVADQQLTDIYAYIASASVPYDRCLREVDSLRALQKCHKNPNRLRAKQLRNSIDSIRDLSIGVLPPSPYPPTIPVSNEQVYQFDLPYLGNWVNIDVLIKVENPASLNLVVNVTLANAEMTDVRLVLPNLDCAVYGLARKKAGQFDFSLGGLKPQLPPNEPAVLVALGKVGDQLYLATKRTTCGSQETHQLVPRPVSQAEMSQQLEALSKEVHKQALPKGVVRTLANCAAQ